jgi:4-hydroxythreonine-4-phosphate dehydrogenase
MGDPAGIGPEIILKALSGDNGARIRAQCRPLVVGSAEMLRHAAAVLGLGAAALRRVGSADAVAETAGVEDAIAVWDLPLDPASVPAGVEGAEAGRAAVEAVRAAVELALAGRVDAIATAPLNKAAIHRAGFAYAGHTELLADLTNTRDYAMMLVAGTLRVVHVSTHVSLREAIERVRENRIRTVIEIADRTLRRMGIAAPRIAVAGLNPHAGEGGLFGREEIEVIAPAVGQARVAGFDASGPHPPDTVFYRAGRGEFDIVVAMYHDQGHIPVKLAGFETGVNVSVGMPFLRTSVDHGTAFDIAYKGVASPGSLIEAILLAARLTGGGA